MGEKKYTYLTVEEAAERWGMSYGGIMTMIHNNDIPFVQIGKRTYRLREEDFIQNDISKKPKGPVEKLAEKIKDYPAEDIFMIGEYADFLESRRTAKKKKEASATAGIPEGWKRIEQS